MRGGDINGPWQWDEIICPTCFMVLAEEAGIARDWRLDARTVNVELAYTTPSGRVWDPIQDLWVEPLAALPARQDEPGLDVLLATLRDRFHEARAGTPEWRDGIRLGLEIAMNEVGYWAARTPREPKV